MRHRNGFTLIELLIVVIIIGILASLAIPRFMDASDRAEAMTVLNEIHSAQQIFKLEHGVYTDSFFDLGINLPTEPACEYRIELTKDGFCAEATSSRNMHMVMYQDGTIKDWTVR